MANINNNEKRVALIILDGWGHGPDPSVSAIAQADTPYVDALYKNYPNAELITFGNLVGLPEGQMGNSEVGHLNIGAGRVVYQELARINKAIKENTIAENETLVNAIEYAKKESKAIHLLGLVSDGGVHSHINHLKGLCDIISEAGVSNVYIHAFTDGRDTDPKNGVNYINDLTQHIKDLPVELASITGRYYAMDRDHRWERIKLAYDALVNGKGEFSEDLEKTILSRYHIGETDEFLKPIIHTRNDKPIAQIEEEDVVLFFNFRTDRPRQLTTVLSQKNMQEYGMHTLPLYFVTMTQYNDSYEGIKVIFKSDELKNTLGEILSNRGFSQLRLAETEKYPHVTFFFNGGREIPFKDEKRVMVPSPKVATYDLQPEMSAIELTKAIIKEIKANKPQFICLNYANTDMVGHTGVFEAAQKAAETVDQCLSRLIPVGFAHNYQFIIIADHGNSDCMKNPDGTPHTAHTTNPVPVFYISENIADGVSIKDGKLADIAPTILSLLGEKIPKEMDGNVLIKS
jgi:2,3-bisphosphoglycerate-independent phosphoglycerate mutase